MSETPGPSNVYVTGDVPASLAGFSTFPVDPGLLDATRKLVEALMEIHDAKERAPAKIGRDLALAATQTEQAIHWLEHASLRLNPPPAPAAPGHETEDTDADD